jgi:hypothetical protein
MAIQKRRSQMVMSSSDIADVYANWPARVAAIETTQEPPFAEQQAAVDREEAAREPLPATGGRTFSKPQQAREIEARDRAKSLGVRVAVVSEARRYITAAQSQPGVLYAIERTPVGWACSCQGYLHTGCCKHLAATQRRAAREGWTFGTIAPLSRVARYFPLDLPENIAIRGIVLRALVA